ncbi:hypothetical protein SCO01_00600 [Staphylococcus cohnii subsp. cohnii]|nr:hypothetical protein SCO01_00600 [Staphylococcus cohnii subsp. cohnii]
MIKPINDEMVDMIKSKGMDKSDLTVISPANVKIISDGIKGNIFLIGLILQ